EGGGGAGGGRGGGGAGREPSAPIAGAQFVAGRLALVLGDTAAARARLEESVTTWRLCGGSAGLALALSYLAMALDPASARAQLLVHESPSLSRDAGDERGVAWGPHTAGAPAPHPRGV